MVKNILQDKYSELNKEIKEKIDLLALKFPKNKKRSLIIPGLAILQEHNNGWLSENLIKSLANYLELPAIAVYEVASFYSMFKLQPPSKNNISICTNLSCMLSGCKSIINHLTKKLNINLNQTNKEGSFSLTEIGCVAACDHAPIIEVNNQRYHKITIDKINEILKQLK